MDFEFCESDLEKVEKCSSYGLPFNKIASLFNLTIKEFNDLRKKDPRINIYLDRGLAEAELKVATTAFDMATSGRHANMTMFWLSRKAGWKETQVIEKRRGIEDLVNGAAKKDNVSPLKKVD